MKIKDIFTRLAKPTAHDETREIEALLARLDADTADARATLAGLEAKRLEALRNDDDKALDGLDAAKLTADRVIEKAGLARPEIEKRLAAARRAARDAAREGFKARQIELAGKLAAALRTAEALNKEAEALDGEIRVALGEHSGLSGITFGGTLLNDGPKTWHAFVEREFGHTHPPSSPPPVVAAKPAAPAAKADPKTKPQKPKRVLPQVPEEGFTRVSVLRSGCETITGLPLAMGDELDLPWEEAKKAVESGACEYSGEIVTV